VPPGTQRRLLAFAIAAVLLAAIVVHLAPNLDDVRQLGRLSAAALIGTVVLLLGSHLAQNESMLVPLRTHLPALGFWELFLVRSGGLVVGSAVPVAGSVAVRLAYLRRQGLTFAAFTHTTIVSNVLALVAAGCLAVPATAMLWFIGGAPPAAALALLGGVLALGLAAMAVLAALPSLAKYPRLLRWLPVDPQQSGVNHSVALRVLGVSVLRHVCSFVAFGWLYAALSGAEGGFLAGGLVYTLTTPIRMVNLTPGNVGVNEWAVAMAGQTLAFDLTTGLLVGGVFRVASLVAQGAGVIFAWALVGAEARSALRP
jgi:hypothetical protein